MPKLPEYQKERDFELLDKTSLNRGTLGGSKPVIRRYYPKFPKKLVLGLTSLVVILVVIYVGATYLYPSFVKKKADAAVAVKPFEYPFNLNDMHYPSDFLQQKFLENFQKASLEKDTNTRYKYLEENFTFLLGFYNSTHSYDYRVQLQKFSDYMQKNYPNKFEANKTLYDFACVDKLCDLQNKYPPEVEEVQKALLDNKSISSGIRDSIKQNLDTAVLSKDRNNQGNAYISVLTSLALEYKTTKDEAVKAMYLKLNDYVIKNYSDYKVPESVKITG